MRLFHILLPILSFLFGASASSLESRQLDAHPVDARDVSDVCALLKPEPFTQDALLLEQVEDCTPWGPSNAPTLNCFKASSVS
jgi:hypothetical protein